MSDDDAFLRVALYIDDSVDMDVMLVFLKALHDDLHGIRNFLIVIAQDLLSDNLGDKELRGLIGQLILVEISGALRQQLFDTLHEHVNAKLVLCRDRKDLCVGQQGMPLLHDVTEMLLIGLVDLVDQQQHRDFHFPNLFQKVEVLFRVLHHICDIEQDVGIGQG